MVNVKPAIYLGTLRHRRFHPMHHEFTYPIFMVCLDIDRVAEMMSISPFTSYNRWNWASYFDEDHFGNPALSLRECLTSDGQAHKAAPLEGKIFLLTHLRYLGYNFNPVSFFFCENSPGATTAIVAEVNNTFGETHNYWLTGCEGNSNSLQYQFQKELHVSPFMQMNQQYDWTFASSGDSLIIQTNSFENGKHIFDATLRLEPREWNRNNLHAVLRRYPWMTLKVVSAIHWQAVQLWWKKVPVAQHPGAGRFARANAQHFAASWSPGAARNAQATRQTQASDPVAQPPSAVEVTENTGEGACATSCPRLESR